MTCPDRQTLSVFADDELDAAKALDVERHVAACANCRQFVHEMQWLEDRGRAALDAINVGNSFASNVVRPSPLWPKWARPLSPAAAAAALVACSIWMWFAASQAGRDKAPSGSHQIARTTPAPTSANGQSEESMERAFDQWAAPYRGLRIPLVPIEVAASYDPSSIPPVIPTLEDRNQL
jgi:anti-sigma factor RsiW